MADHNHTIAEVYRLQEELDKRAPKQHVHEGYAPAEHQHKEYAPKNHDHSQYALREHKHDEYATKKHEHKDYARTDHTHPELEKAIRNNGTGIIMSKGKAFDLDNLKANILHTVILTNSGAVKHIADYFQSERKTVFNCQNILIAKGKRFAARICRTETENIVLFDGIIND